MANAKKNIEKPLKGPEHKVLPIRLTNAGEFSDKKLKANNIKTIRPKGPYGQVIR